MHDHRARARFPRPDLRTAAGWGRSPRSLTGDPSFERVSRSLWARLPSSARTRETTAAHQLVSSAAAESQPFLNLWERAALLQLHCADGLIVSHLSAAQLWGLPLSSSPAPWTHGLLGEATRFRALESRPQLSYLEHRRNEHSEAMLLHKSVGLRPVLGPWGAMVSSPAETLLGCMPWLPGWRAVAAVDRMLVTGSSLHGPLDRLSADSLLKEADGLPAGTRGIARFRRAVGLSAASTWSPMETLLRLLVVRAGFAEPAMNLPVVAQDGSRFVLDLAWPEQLTALEYNGRVHYEDRKTYGDEQHRLHLLADAGWAVRTVVAADLKEPQRTAALMHWLRTRLS